MCRWAVRLPPELGFTLRLGFGNVSPKGLPLGEAATSKSFDITPDADTHEAFLSFGITEGERGYGSLHVNVPGSKSVIGVVPEVAGLFSGKTDYTQFSVGDKPVARSANSSIILLVRRSSKLENNHAKGVVLWLEPTK